jgi:hypothetical protein
MIEKNKPEFIQMLKQEDLLWSELRNEYLTDMIQFIKDPEKYLNQGHMIYLCLKVCLANTILNQKEYETVSYSFEEFVDNIISLLSKNWNELTEKRVQMIRSVIWGYVFSNLDLMVKIAENFMEEENELDIEKIYNIEDKAGMLYTCVLVAAIEISIRFVELKHLIS